MESKLTKWRISDTFFMYCQFSAKILPLIYGYNKVSFWSTFVNSVVILQLHIGGLHGGWLTVDMSMSVASTVSTNIFMLYDIVIQRTIRKEPTK